MSDNNKGLIENPFYIKDVNLESTKGKHHKIIGVLTDPSETYRVPSMKKLSECQYDQLPENIKFKEQSAIQLFGGNFKEISSLITVLSIKWNVLVLLYLGKNIFISGDSILSPFDMVHPSEEKKSDFEKWAKRVDAFVISLNKNNLEFFLSCYHKKLMQMKKPYIFSTGSSIINKLIEEYHTEFKFVERKGVARFGSENRREIFNYLERVL
jgi:hypothetical protein